MLIRFLTLFTLLAGLCSGEIRRFQNADETKSFFGELVDYDAKKKVVVVKMKKGGRKSRFALELLSKNDQKYVLKNADRIAVAKNIDVTLDKFTEKSKKILRPRIVNRIQASGYEIKINNRSKNAYKNITFRYTLYYAKQGYLKPERKELAKHGSVVCEKITPQQRQTIKTETVDIISGRLEPVIENERKRGADGEDYIEPVVKEPGGKRKDLLLGIKVEVVVDDVVIKTVTDGTLKIENRAK